MIAEINKAFKDGEDTWIYKAFDFFATRVENFFAYMLPGPGDLAGAQTRPRLQDQGAPPSGTPNVGLELSSFSNQVFCIYFVRPVPSSESRERATGNEGDRLNNSPGDSGIDVLEKRIKEMTFTKAEINRLIEVMHSRIAGKSNLVKLIKAQTFTKAEIDHLSELMLSRIVGESTEK